METSMGILATLAAASAGTVLYSRRKEQHDA